MKKNNLTIHDFKVGDYVICIDNNNMLFPISIGTKYIIAAVKTEENMIYVKKDDDKYALYLFERFVPLKKYRNNRLCEILK